MQLTRRKAERDKVELQMAPMIDVVFLLLIFFIFASEWKVENDLTTDMPSKVKKVVQKRDFEPVRIALIKRGDVFEIRCNESACRDFAELYGKLKALRRLSDVPVTISANRKLPFQIVVNAVDAAVKAKFTKIGFAAT